MLYWKNLLQQNCILLLQKVFLNSNNLNHNLKGKLQSIIIECFCLLRSKFFRSVPKMCKFRAIHTHANRLHSNATWVLQIWIMRFFGSSLVRWINIMLIPVNPKVPSNFFILIKTGIIFIRVFFFIFNNFYHKFSFPLSVSEHKMFFAKFYHWQCRIKLNIFLKVKE